MLKYGLYILVVLLITLAIKKSFKEINEDNYSLMNFLKEIYLKNFTAYILAITLIIISAISIKLSYNYIPNFLKYSWLSFFSEQPINLIAKPILETKNLEYITKIITLIIIVILSIIFMPLLAYNEEKDFRSYKTEFYDIIKNSFKFAIIHIPMGIPLYAVFIIFIFGLLFSFIYRKKYLAQKFTEENIELDVFNANKIATMHVCRIHALFNILIILNIVIICV